MAEGRRLVEHSGSDLRFAADSYALSFPSDRPFVYVYDTSGELIAELFFLSSIHPSVGRDDTTSVTRWYCAEAGEETVFSAEAGSSVWDRKIFRFRCRPDRFTYEVVVSGHGSLAEANYFGGYASAFPRWGSGFFLSGHRFEQGFNPEPTAAATSHFDPASGAVIDLTGAPLPGKRHWFFNPAPFCLAVRARQSWLGMGVEVRPGSNGFTEYRYHAQDGFFLSLSYEGHTRVDDHLELPAIAFDFGASPDDVLRAHVASLQERGWVPGSRCRSDATPDTGEEHARPAIASTTQPRWWRRPMFCGWGAQCYLAGVAGGYVAGSDGANVTQFLATMHAAPSFSRQDVYEEFIAHLAAHDVRPGTVVIDDKWQASYGENDVDGGKWPNLPGFIRDRHAAGQRVLLWLKAWDREGVPDDECIVNAGGVALTVDPTNPAFECRLRRSVRRMLSPDEYDADGFKIDFTHRIPTGPGLRCYGDAWGLELMRRYLHIIYQEAKVVKPDALVMTHTPHPYLSDVLDMIRLNDMVDLTRLDDPNYRVDVSATLRNRSAVARIGCPSALIDTDNWPVRDKASWREFVKLQPTIGVPSLYFATHIDLTQEPLNDSDYRAVREAWNGIDATA